MLRELKVSTIGHRSGITLIPCILFLVIMLALASPRQSESAEKQFINTSQRTVTESKKDEEATKVTHIQGRSATEAEATSSGVL